MGGGFALLLASGHGFSAASINYGGPLPKDIDDFLNTACPVVGSYGGLASWEQGVADQLAAALDRALVPHDVKEYPDAGHSFMNNHRGYGFLKVLRFKAVGYNEEAHHGHPPPHRRLLPLALGGLQTMNSEHQHESENQNEPADLSGLCRIGGIAALLLVIYSLEMMVQMVILGGQPTSAAQAFDLLQHHRVWACLRLDLPTIAVMPLYYLVFLGLFAALRRDNLCPFAARYRAGLRRHNSGAGHAHRSLHDPAQ